MSPKQHVTLSGLMGSSKNTIKGGPGKDFLVIKKCTEDHTNLTPEAIGPKGHL